MASAYSALRLNERDRSIARSRNCTCSDACLRKHPHAAREHYSSLALAENERTPLARIARVEPNDGLGGKSNRISEKRRQAPRVARDREHLATGAT